MRKLFVSNMVSVDGFIAKDNGNIDWHNVDDEFNKYAVEMMNNVGLMLFGRITHDLMYSYWPTAEKDPKTGPEDLIIAKLMNNLPKIVYSKTLENSEWNNTQLRHELDLDELKKLKEQDGKDIVIFGSGQIVSQLTAAKLIDKYRLILNPVILGNGKSQFKDLKENMKLKLIDTQTFTNGNVMVSYEI